MNFHGESLLIAIWDSLKDHLIMDRMECIVPTKTNNNLNIKNNIFNILPLKIISLRKYFLSYKYGITFSYLLKIWLILENIKFPFKNTIFV